MNQNLANHINQTEVTKRIIEESLAYAKENKTHVAYAVGKILSQQNLETLVKSLEETDNEEYLLTDASKEAEQKEIAEQVILNTLLIWLPRIGQDMKQFAE